MKHFAHTYASSLLLTVLLLAGNAACSLFGNSEGSDDGAAAILAAAMPGGSSSGSACLASWPYSSGAYLADSSVNPSIRADTFGDPLLAQNRICGGGWSTGGTDVYTLGNSSECETGESCLVLHWNGKRVLNGSGIDFVVYENAFLISSPSRYFIEAVIVEVSEDGANWCGWSPNYSGGDSTRANVQNPDNYTDMAGLTPVLFKQSDTNTLGAADLFSTTADEHGTHLSGGGDGFDLSSANFGSTGNGCNTTLRDSLRSGGFVYVRLTTANSRNPTAFPANPDSFDQQGDIDGVVARSVADR